MKNLTVPIAIAIGIVGSVLAVGANMTASKMKENLDQERYKRMVAEEQLQSAKGAVKTLESELTASQGKIASIEQILKNDKNNLESQLGQITKERDNLKQQMQTLQPSAAPGPVK